MSRWSAIEKKFRAAGCHFIAGADEVGRGPLAGPVVACVIVMPPGERAIAGVADSKELSAADRERLAPSIRRKAAAFALGAASVREIDRLNITVATAIAIRRAAARLRHPYDLLLVDGLPMKHLVLEHRAVIDGDAKCYSVACASILAKVTRDRLLARLAARHPGYGWERNMGYGTAVHIAAIRERGLTAHHRVGFCRSALNPHPPSPTVV